MKGFVQISRYSGMREDLVQGGGGNSAYKISSERMLIKASGYQLSDITGISGYAVVNPYIIRKAFLSETDIDNMTEEDSKKILEKAFVEGEKPSIETFLHSVSGKYSLHTHPIVVNVMTCRKDGIEILKKLFPEALFVPYATPGINLAKAYFKAYREQAGKDDKIFDIVFLQNHGLLVSANSAEEIISITEHIVRIIEDYLGIDMKGYHYLTDIWKEFSDRIIWKVTDENILKLYRKRGSMWNYTFCPDCVVFLGKKALLLNEGHIAEDKKKFCAQYGEPIIAIYHNNLYIIAESVRKALEIQSVMSFSAQVMDLNEERECNFLSEKEQNFLVNWEAEKYRKTIK